MGVLDKLASALDRNDERPNVELAEVLAASGDDAGIAELVAVLTTGTPPVQNDAIKVLYEIGETRPELVAGHAEAFFALLASRNNRNVWGALQAIDSITASRPEIVAARLEMVIAAADKGSVIAKDRAMSILAKLAATGFADPAVPILLDRLEHSAANQFPSYAELAFAVVSGRHQQKLKAILENRVGRIEQPAKRSRIEKLLRKLAK